MFADRKSHWWHYRVHTDASESTAVPVSSGIPAEEKRSDIHSCTHCSELFADQADLQNHIKVQHSNAADGDTTPTEENASGVHSCTLCPELLADHEDLQNHMKDRHCNTAEEDTSKQPNEYRCSRCAEVFPDLEQHWWHYGVHTDTEFVASVRGLSIEKSAEPRPVTTPGRYQCSKCPESFPDRKAHWVHYKTHKMSCNSTGRYVATPEPVKVKKEGAAQDGKLQRTEAYKCNQCSKVQGVPALD